MGYQEKQNVKNQVERSDSKIESMNVDATPWDPATPYSFPWCAEKVGCCNSDEINTCVREKHDIADPEEHISGRSRDENMCPFEYDCRLDKH